MIHLTVRRLKDDYVDKVTDWLTEVDSTRREEAIATLVAEGVRHETASILRTSVGSFLIYAMETDDIDRARDVGAASSTDIDKRHHEVMRAADGGRPEITQLLSIP